MSGRRPAATWRAPAAVRVIGLALLLMAWVGAACAASGGLHAFLDRSQAQLGDTVTLNVRLDGASSVTAPDLGALQKDFEVLGTSRSTSLNIVNGHSTQKILWAVALRPRHAGTLTIPPLTLDGRATEALTLTVTAAPATAQGGPGDDVYIKATLDTDTPYVGQQVNLTVRLFYAPNLTDGNLDKPQADGLDVRALGSGTRYQVERSGRRYHVLEQHFALIPRRAGAITLAPLRFRGSALDVDGFPGFMGTGRTVQARSAALSMQVRTRPASAGKGVWLPARAVSLHLDGLPADGRVQVGEPLTLTLTEQASGVPAEALPEPQLPTLDGVQTYPDRSNDHTGNDGEWLQASRARKFAIVPQHPGTLTIPAITLRWWNVVSDRMQVTTLPAHTLQVTAAAGAAAASAGSAGAPAAGSNHARAPGKPFTAGAGWRVVALVSLALWVLSMGLGLCWWRWRKTRRHVTKTARSPDSRRLRNAFLHAVRGGDAATQVNTLLAWARAERPSLRNLAEVSAALDSPVQCAAIGALQAARYADAGAPPDPAAVAAAFAGGLQWRASAKAAANEALPPLYPRH